jgi:hypothetical protein
MKATASTIAVTIFGVLVSVAAASYDKLVPYRWETYKAPNGAFSIDLPGTPNVEAKRAPAEDGSMVTINLVSVQPTNHVAYTCAYTDREGTSDKSPKEILELARDGSLMKIQGSLISQKQITSQGYPGLEWQARARGNSMVDARDFAVGNRLYMIMAVATDEHDREPKTIQRIFDSFRILKQ